MAVTKRLEEEAPELEELKARVSDNPNDLQPLRELGWALYGRHQTDEAVEKLEQATKRFPEDPESHYALGLAYKRAGSEEKARQSFRKAIEKSEDDPDKVRSSMMLRLAKRQLHLLEHGTWELTE